MNPTWTGAASGGPSGYGAAGTPAARAGAQWDSLWSGNASGSYNTVKPEFENFSLADQFRPNDKILINAALRYDDFTYKLPDSANAADNFYANMTANYTCVYVPTNQVLTQLLAAGQPPPANAQYVNGSCDTAAALLHPAGPHTGWVHPNGTTQNGVAAPNFTAASPELVHAQLLGTAVLGDLYANAGRRLAHLSRSLHAAADLRVRPVLEPLGGRAVGLE